MTPAVLPLPRPQPVRVPGRALVLDEDPVVRVALQNVLAVLGWDVLALGDEVAAALDAVAGEDRYGLIVVDRGLGDGLADDLARMLPLLQPTAHVVMLGGAVPCPVPEGVSVLLPRGQGLGPLLDHLAARAA